MNRQLHRPMLGVALLAGLSPLVAQSIEARLPTNGTYDGNVQLGTGDAIVIQGVPGEISVIRLEGHGASAPHLGKLVDGWSLTLLQANQQTHPPIVETNIPPPLLGIPSRTLDVATWLRRVLESPP